MKKTLKVWRAAGFRALGYYPAQIAGFDFRCDPDHIDFWKGAARGLWEPHTLETLRRHLTPDSRYVDIGSWIGPTVLYASRLARRVVCFEPDYVAYEYLLTNIRLNGLTNVEPFPVALAECNGILKMAGMKGILGDSVTSLLKADESGSIPVCAMRWDTFISQMDDPIFDFLKIDIEGGEFNLLPDMASWLSRHKPVVYLSTHAPFLPEAERLAAMEKILDVMHMYRECRDESSTPVSYDFLVADDSLRRPRTFLFTD